MIAADIRIDQLDGAHWTRLLELSQPDASEAPADPLLLVFVEKGRVVRALKPRRGPIDPAAIAWEGPGTHLSVLRARQRARRIIVLEDGAIGEALHLAESRLDYGQDYAEQIWTILQAVRERLGRDIHVDPPPWKLPPLGWDLVQGIFDRLWPDGTSAVLYVVDEDADAIHTSLILTKERGDVVRMTSHRAVGGALGKHWRSDYKRINAAVAEQVAPVHVALYANLPGARALVRGRTPLAAAVAARQAIIDPGPPWALPVAVGFYAWHLVSSAVSSFLGDHR